MPQAEPAGAVIVFDGVCVLCNGWVGFLLRHDLRGRYRYAAMQSDAGRDRQIGHHAVKQCTVGRSVVV